jgi:hypothetical protein
MCFFFYFWYLIRFSLECSGMDFWSRYSFKMTTPLLLGAIVLFNFGVKRAVYLYQSKAFNYDFYKGQSVSLYVSVMGTFYTLLIATGVTPLVCFRREDGSYAIRSSPANLCYDSKWYSMLPLMLIFLGVYCIGFPLVLAVVFFSQRKNIFNPRFIKNYGSLVEAFKFRVYWWELIMLIKRSSFVIVAKLGTLASSNNTSPYFFTIMLLFVFHVIELMVMPFKRLSTFVRSSTWLILSIVILLCDGFIFRSDAVPEIEKTFFASFMLILMVSGIAGVLIQFRRQKSRASKFKEKKNLRFSALGQASQKTEILLPDSNVEGFEEILDGLGLLPPGYVIKKAIIKLKTDVSLDVHHDLLWMPTIATTQAVPSTTIGPSSSSTSPAQTDAMQVTSLTELTTYPSAVETSKPQV